MHFGRCHPVPEKSYPLPTDGLRTQKYLSLPFSGKGKVFIGAPILGQTEWQGIIYPHGAASGNLLEHYSKVFNSLELNSSFYAQPSITQVKKWKQNTSPNFKFAAKVPRQISEGLSSREAVDNFDAFADAINAFEEKLGLTFLQLSESFSPQRKDQLYEFLSKIKGRLPLAVELRHPSWFKEHCLIDELVNHLYVNQFVPVITDTIGKRHALHTSLCGQKIMIRFLAYDHVSDEQRLGEWAHRIKHWVHSGMDEIYFFLHHEEHKKIPLMLQNFVRLLLDGLESCGDLKSILDLELAPMEQPDLFSFPN
ncbi:MAG: DUF72 domain-containing protein [Oligoflexales bacterium]|nr:DUF72 domain-containing protein [Oligoflexales bacterium]